MRGTAIVCVETVEEIERANHVQGSAFFWKSKAGVSPDSLRSCEICDIPVFLYPSDFPGVCENCIHHLRQFERRKLKPCERCGRGHTYKLYCNCCNKKMCQGCVYRDHQDEVDEEREREHRDEERERELRGRRQRFKG